MRCDKVEIETSCCDSRYSCGWTSSSRTVKLTTPARAFGKGCDTCQSKQFSVPSGTSGPGLVRASSRGGQPTPQMCQGVKLSSFVSRWQLPPAAAAATSAAAEPAEVATEEAEKEEAVDSDDDEAVMAAAIRAAQAKARGGGHAKIEKLTPEPAEEAMEEAAGELEIAMEEEAAEEGSEEVPLQRPTDCLACAGYLDTTTTASPPCTCAAPFRLPSDAAAWRVCAPWDARVLLTRAELDVLLLPAKRKGDYSAADYE